MNKIHDEDDPREPLAKLPPLYALRAFHAAARFGRFRDAAEALNLSESAVSHQVRKLETYLGVRLFEREGNRVRLSATGETYFSRIDPAFATLRKATEDLAGPCCRVSLTLPRSLATMWLIPRLAGLEEAVPEISLQMVTTSRLCDLRREQIDLGIRYGRGNWGRLVVRHLFDEEAFPVCSPGYLSGRAAEGIAAVVSSCRLIVDGADEWRDWTAARGLPQPLMANAIAVHSSYDVLEAAAQGLGLGIGRRPLVDRYLKEGRLVAPFGSTDRSGHAYYLIYPDDVEPSVPVRKVARWLVAAAGGEAPAPA